MDLTIENYQILNEIGSGGICKVYKCSHSNGNLFAMKKVQMKYWGNPILFECMVLSSFNCPYLMKAEEIIIDKDLLIIMELAKCDLCKELKSNIPQLDKLMEWIYYLLLALDCLHRANIIHGDVKAKNILLMNDGKIRLNDFNLSRYTFLFPERKSGYTVTHRAPEIWKDEKWDTSADIWALGCTIFEMATGTTLFHSVSREGKTRTQYDKEMQMGIFKFMKEVKGINLDLDNSIKGKYATIPDYLLSSKYKMVWTMINLCLSMDSLKRPSIDSLLNTYYKVNSIHYGPLTTPIFEISDEVTDMILNKDMKPELKNAVRHLLKKLPPSYHNFEIISTLLSLIFKLFFFPEVIVTRRSMIDKENELCKRLVFNLYFLL